jgi:TPR repeat protein
MSRARFKKLFKATRESPSYWGELGYFYLWGEGTKVDYKKAYRCFSTAITLGDIESNYWKGFCLEGGLGCRRDLRSAIKYFKVALKYGNARSLYHLHYCCRGLKQHALSLNYLRQATKAGVEDAIYDYSLLLLKNDSLKIKALAYKNFVRLSRKGDSDAFLMKGYCEFYGLGTRKDWARAISSYRKAAAKKQPKAIYNLALCYFYGNGFKMNKVKAKRLIKVAIKLGNNGAQRFLKKRF